MINLTYVSECRIAGSETVSEIELILACANERNARDKITGVLLFTGRHFAQTLEGAAPEVDGLFASIGRDWRHAVLAVVDRRVVVARKFPHWSLSYAGPSLFVAATVARGLTGFHLNVPADVERLLKLMVEFGKTPPLKPAPSGAKSRI